MEQVKQSAHDKFEHLVCNLHEYQDVRKRYKDLLNSKDGIIPTWSSAHFYKIDCNDESVKDFYIGNRVHIPRAMNKHKNYCNNANHRMHSVYLYLFMRDHGGWDNWSYEILETATLTITEQRKLKRHYIETLKATLNTNIPIRTERQTYYQH